MSQPRGYTRRAFLQRGLTVVSTAATLPAFVQRSAFGLDNPFAYRQTAQRPGVPEDRVLVVVQLAGGNDGLNTVVPFGDDDYYRLRPNLAVRQADVLKLDERQGLGLHPSLEPLKALHDEGQLATLLGTGYPNPNRSHFKSMDIWHTANPQREGAGRGWLGRYFDNQCEGQPQPDLCIAIGREAPLATQGNLTQPIAFEDERLFQWSGQSLHEDLADRYQAINRAGVLAEVDGDSPQAFLMRTALDAQVSSDAINKAASTRPAVSYPSNRLGRDLKLVAAMIRAELPTRVYYVSMGGFDTHAGQAGRHARLLGDFARAIKAFQDDLQAQGNGKRVVTMTFSEFGRRVRQNGSGGTDHGTAAPMFIIGEPVKGGLLGRQPSLTRLDDNGDLIYSLDFRQAYSTVLGQWMSGPSEQILGGKFDDLPLFNV